MIGIELESKEKESKEKGNYIFPDIFASMMKKISQANPKKL
jgi:hypothetical protein